jgi:hypothetical protein
MNYNEIDMKGQVFGRLTVLSKSSKRTKGRDVFWTCQCSCGIVKDINGYSIRSGNTLSCGCLRLDIIRKPDAQLNKLFGQYQRSAKRRSLTFELDKDFFQSLVTSSCYYCGLEPLDGFGGIDRIDSKNGYYPQNCRPCCAVCNIMKWNLSDKHFHEHIERIFINEQRRNKSSKISCESENSQDNRSSGN